MKEVIFLVVPQMGFGGQERFVSRLSEMLHELYDVYVVVFDDSVINYKIFGNVLSIHQMSLKGNFIHKSYQMLQRILSLKKLIHKYKPIACFCFGRAANTLGVLCKNSNMKVITSIRGYGTVEQIDKSVLDKLTYKKADKITCVSMKIADKMRELIPECSSKIDVLYNAYRCDEIKQKSKEKYEIRDRKGPYLSSVGTLRYEKGYWHLIKAIAIIKKTYPEVVLTIAGENSGDNEKKIIELIDLLNLRDNVKLAGWNDNPYKIIGSSDIYVLSSVREGFPNALVEAMACGKAVIANDCLTGPREILSKDEFKKRTEGIEFADYGVLIERMKEEEDYSASITKDEETLAKAIMYLYENDDMRRNYEKKSVERSGMFSYERCREKVINYFSDN